MKITSVGLPNISTTKKQFVNAILEQRLKNDHILENTFINISIVLDSPIQLFYRVLWEVGYLRRTPAYPKLSRGNTVVIRFSISECISYIYQVTPPALQKDIPDNITSIEKIRDLMEYFLITEQRNRGTDQAVKTRYISVFFMISHMEIFDTAWTPDFNKISFVKKRVKSFPNEHQQFIGVVDTSTIPIKELIETDPYAALNSFIQLSFHADTEKDFVDMYRFFELTGFVICNLYCDENIGLVVAAYTDKITPKTVFYIKNIYDQLFGKK